jgi:hypothetical protein
MQQHGGLPKLGSSIKQDGLAPKAAAEEILRKSGTADELSRAEDRFFGERIVERSRNHGVPYRIDPPCAIGGYRSEVESQPFRMMTISQDSPACESSRRAFVFLEPSGSYQYAILKRKFEEFNFYYGGVYANLFGWSTRTLLRLRGLLFSEPGGRNQSQN